MADHELSVVEAEMEFIEVSPEMTALLGRGRIGAVPLPDEPVALVYGFADAGGPAIVSLDVQPSLQALSGDGGDTWRLIFLVDRGAVLRLGGEALLSHERLAAYMPRELRAIAAALRDPPTSPQARSTYRLAKAIELFCETLRMHAEDQLIPAMSEGALSPCDTRRVIAARKLIDERWCEKLTLDAIARACGLNRAKLTRGFREVFDCTVAEALAERRLSQASRLLLTTDLPISSVGYEAGYMSNASFARAFGRHFGRSPSDYRATGMAA